MLHRLRVASSLLALATALLSAVETTAQCTPFWQDGDPLPYVRGSVAAAVAWDPDGAGPAALQLVVAGTFAAGTMASTHVALFDGSEWTPLGNVAGHVAKLAVWNGQLIAAVNEPFHDTVLQWSGSSWQPVGSALGAAGRVYTLGSWNGDLFVGGYFTQIGGVAANSIASWNGSTWTPLGAGVAGDVRALVNFDNLLLVGGSITSTGGIAAGNLGAWNGSSWLATATFNGSVECFAVRSTLAINSEVLYVGGSFTTCGAASTPLVARYVKSTGLWGGAAGGIAGASCRALFANNGALFGTEVTAAVDAPGSTLKMWRWNGAAWSNLGGVDDARGDVTPTGVLLWNGQYLAAMQDADQALRQWNGSSWLPLRGAGLGGPVYAVNTAGADIVIGGTFASISGVTMNGIARGAPGAWQPLGSGTDVGGIVNTIARTTNGDVIAGGTFVTAGGIAVNNVARWNGSGWSSLGPGLDDSVYALLTLPNGDLVATGRFTHAGTTVVNRIARWNGTSWSPFGTGLSAQGNALALAANGDILAGGNFQQAGPPVVNRVARWNGTSWAPLGQGFNIGVDNAVFALAVLPDGTIAVGGHFQHAGLVAAPYVALWNGSTWSAPPGVLFRPNADVLSLLALPNGDLIAGGVTFSFDLGFPFNIHTRTNLARWYGSAWDSFDVTGLAVFATAMTADGSLIAGGDFALTNGVPFSNVARLATPCPALATPYGLGCTSAGGNNTLTADNLPWVDATFRATGTGLPSLAIVLALTSVTPIAPPLPLSLALPIGVPGCNLLVAPDILEAQVATTGTAHSQLFLPNTPPLVGVTFYHQMLPIEIDALGNFVALTATNALQLTAGTY